MRYIFVLLLALCVSPAFADHADAVKAKTGGGSAVVVGTLADASDPFDMALAPQYTRVIFLRQSTASALRGMAAKYPDNSAVLSSGLEKSKAVQARADEARAALDALREQIKATQAKVSAANAAYDEFNGVTR